MASTTNERRPPAVEDIEVGIDRFLRPVFGLWKIFLVLLILGLIL